MTFKQSQVVQNIHTLLGPQSWRIKTPYPINHQLYMGGYLGQKYRDGLGSLLVSV
jgi:hypothetical protein